MVQLTDKQKYEIVIKHKIGINNTQIAKDLNITRKTVIKWITKYNKDQNIERKSGSGRKKI